LLGIRRKIRLIVFERQIERCHQQPNAANGQNHRDAKGHNQRDQRK